MADAEAIAVRERRIKIGPRPARMSTKVKSTPAGRGLLHDRCTPGRLAPACNCRAITQDESNVPPRRAISRSVFREVHVFLSIVLDRWNHGVTTTHPDFSEPHDHAAERRHECRRLASYLAGRLPRPRTTCCSRCTSAGDVCAKVPVAKVQCAGGRIHVLGNARAPNVQLGVGYTVDGREVLTRADQNGRSAKRYSTQRSCGPGSLAPQRSPTLAYSP